MIIIGVIVAIAGLIALCWIMFNCAVYILPLFAAVWAGRYAHACGIDWPGAIIIGILCGISTLGAGALALAFVRPIWLKLVIAAVFVAPAGYAGYFMGVGLAHLITHEIISVTLIATIAAISVAATAFTRLLSLVTTAFPTDGRAASA